MPSPPDPRPSACDAALTAPAAADGELTPGSGLRFRSVALALAAGWTLLVAVLTYWHVATLWGEAESHARYDARMSFQRDVVYRLWATMHGGVYVPATDATPPNPLLADLPERDLVTPSGRRLTLVNPAYMTRQVHALAEERFGLRSHITSLRPIRAGNAPDAWERQALQRFETGAAEVAEVRPGDDGRPVLRFMRPFRTEAGCLKCHAAHGYKEGDIRGGISVTLPMAPYRVMATQEARTVFFKDGLVWLTGLAGLGLGFVRLKRRRDAHLASLAALRASEEKFRAIANYTPNLEIWTGPDGRARWVNPGAETITGYTPEECLAMVEFPHGLIVPEDRERLAAEIAAAAQGGRGHDVLMQIVRKDGAVRWVSASWQPIHDAQGRPLGRRTSVRDVTARVRLNRTLEFLAQGGWETAGEGFMPQLAAHLGGILGVDHVIVARLKDAHTARTEGLYARGAIAPNLEYALAGTPCRHVVGQALCHHAGNVQALFPEDKLLVDMGAQSYLGQPLWDSQRRPIGLIAIVDSKPMPDPADAIELLEVAAIRAGAEFERRAAEDALRRSEERFRRIVETANEGVWAMDRHHRTSFVNARMARMLGYEPAEILGREVEEFMFAADLAAHRERMAQRHAGQGGEYEHRFRRKDGGEVWTIVSATALRDARGEFDGSFAMFADITARRRAEAALRETDANLQALFDATSQTAFLIDLRGTVLAINAVGAQRLGRTPADVLGTDVYTHLPPEIVAARRARVEEVVATGRPVRFEDVRAGRRLDQTLVPVRDAAGRVARIAVFAEDVTERVWAEQAVREQLAELQRWHNVMLDREDRVRELKREVNALCRAQGAAVRYPSQESGSAPPAPAPPA